MAARKYASFKRVTAAVAWAGYVVSIVQIGMVALDGLQRDRGGAVTRVLYYDDGERAYEPIGQVYRGNEGTVLASVEVSVFIAALMLAHMRPRWPRRVGLIGIVAWTVLWLGNAIWFLAIAPGAWVFWVHLAFVGPPAISSLIYCADRWPLAPSPPLDPDDKPAVTA